MVIRDELTDGIQYRIIDGANLRLLDLQLAIKEKANQYNIPLAFRRDVIHNNIFEYFIGVLKTECMILYNPESGPKSIGYVMVLRTEGTYLFINLFKHIFCHDNWATIVKDIFNEIFT